MGTLADMNHSIFVIGDSISIGYGPTLERALVGHASYARKGGEAEALQNLDIPVGANGGDSGMVLEYLRSLQAEGFLKQTLLVLNCGLHDIKVQPDGDARQVPLEAYQTNLQTIATITPALAEQVVWVRITPVIEERHNSRKPFWRYQADVDAYNTAADAIAHGNGWRSIDLHAFVRAQGEHAFTKDGVHFKAGAEAEQGCFIAGFLASLLPMTA